MKKIRQSRWQAAFCLGAGILLLGSPATAARGMRTGIDLCLKTTVPSLFPFMVLAEYIAARVAGLPQRSSSRTRVPPRILPIVFTAFLGGYPAGAAGCAGLLHNGAVSAAQAQRWMALACMPSPAFLICAVGQGLYGSPAVGAVLWGCTALGAAAPFFLSPSAASKKTVPYARRIAAGLSPAVERACRGLFLLCGHIVLFSTLQAYADLLPLSPAVSAAAAALLEITGGAARCVQAGLPLWFLAFAAGWGGVCVHGQVFSFFAPGELSRPLFAAARFLHGCASALLAAWCGVCFPQVCAVFGNAEAVLPRAHASSAPAGAALLLLCAMFLACDKVLPQKQR